VSRKQYRPLQAVAVEPELPPHEPFSVRSVSTTPHGRKEQVRLDPASFRCRRLAAALADAWVSLVAADRLADRSTSLYRDDIRRFCDFVDRTHAEPQKVTLAGVDVGLTDAYELSLVAASSETSDMPARASSRLFVLIVWAAQRLKMEVDPRLVERAKQPPLTRRRRQTVLSDYPNAERAVIERTARSDVTRLRRDIAARRGLLEKGVDPGEGGWEVLANLVVRAAAGSLTVGELRQNLPQRWSELPEDIRALVSPGERTSGAGRKRAGFETPMGPVISRIFELFGEDHSPSDIAVLVNAEGLRTVGGRRWSTATVESTLARRYPNSERSMAGTNALQAELEDRWSPSVLQRRLVDLVFPSEQTLLPIVILFMLATGLPPESVRDLGEDCITEVTAAGVRLRYLKDRAGVIAEKHFTGATPFSVAKLVATAHGATFDTRSRLIAMGRTEGASRLFLCATVPKQPAQPSFESVYRFGVVNVLPANFHSTFARWIRDHGLTVGGPNDLRRLRKTRKVSRAIALGGVVQDIADDHTTRVADQHYMCTTSLNILSARVIGNAQNRLFNELSAGPTVVTPAVATALLRTGELDPKVEALLSGQFDVGLAACADVRKSPFAEPGVLCPAAFGGSCFDCTNAIVTEAHLPAIVSFLALIDEQRRHMPPPAWAAAWAAIRQRIAEELLPSFPASVVDAARRGAGQSLQFTTIGMTGRSFR